MREYKKLMEEMILLMNQGYLRLEFMIERKARYSMNEHMTIGLGHITSSKFNISQGLLCGGILVLKKSHFSL